MIWRVSDVSDEAEYKLHLCESKDGDRFFRLVLAVSDIEGDRLDDVILVTAIVPNDLLKRRSLLKIAELIPLNNGQPFFVEAHGMWLTEEEARGMDSNVNFNDIRWVTGRVPNFAQR